MTMNIHEQMLAILEERFGIQASSVTVESRLKEDLDLDSIDLFDIIGVIEKKLGLSVDISDFVRVKTVGDVIRVIESLAAKAPAA